MWSGHLQGMLGKQVLQGRKLSRDSFPSTLSLGFSRCLIPLQGWATEQAQLSSPRSWREEGVGIRSHKLSWPCPLLHPACCGVISNCNLMEGRAKLCFTKGKGNTGVQSLLYESCLWVTLGGSREPGPFPMLQPGSLKV